MRKTLPILLILLLLASIPSSAMAKSPQSTQPVVHSILFWSSGCPYCTQTIANTLPGIQEKYNGNLSVLLVELVSIDDVNQLYALGAELGYPKEQVAVPFLLVDHTALIGAEAIQNSFPGLIDEYLTAGGVEYADMPQLGELLPRGVVFTDFKLVPQTAAKSGSIDIILAWGIMAILGAALLISIVMVIRAFNGVPLSKLSRSLELAIPILSMIGLGISIYLAYVEMTQSRAICGPVGDCNAVQNSPYAKLFGVVPIGVVGMVGYIAILAAWFWQHYRTGAVSKIAGPVMFGMALFGTLFSAYLTYLEIYIIHAVCIWCLSSAVIMALLLVLNLPYITQWLAITDEEEQLVE